MVDPAFYEVEMDGRASGRDRYGPGLNPGASLMVGRRTAAPDRDTAK